MELRRFASRRPHKVNLENSPPSAALNVAAAPAISSYPLGEHPAVALTGRWQSDRNLGRTLALGADVSNSFSKAAGS